MRKKGLRGLSGNVPIQGLPRSLDVLIWEAAWKFNHWTAVFFHLWRRYHNWYNLKSNLKFENFFKAQTAFYIWILGAIKNFDNSLFFIGSNC